MLIWIRPIRGVTCKETDDIDPELRLRRCRRDIDATGASQRYGQSKHQQPAKLPQTNQSRDTNSRPLA